jgi:alkylated DNA repair dioxygenase AlkB
MPLCNAQTLAKTECKIKVKTEGERCRFHVGSAAKTPKAPKTPKAAKTPEKPEAIIPERIDLTNKSYLLIQNDFIKLTPSEYKQLVGLCPKKHSKVIVFGKEHEIPRYQRLYGEAVYKFSGVEAKNKPLDHPVLVKILKAVKSFDPHPERYNGMLVNWYPDGNSHIGPHSDSEDDLIKGAPIYSISFGATRTFRFHRIPKKGPKFLDASLKDGMMVAMCGDTQKEFVHSIPVEKKVKEMRINITIRAFKPEAVSRAKK